MFCGDAWHQNCWVQMKTQTRETNRVVVPPHGYHLYMGLLVQGVTAIHSSQDLPSPQRPTSLDFLVSGDRPWQPCFVIFNFWAHRNYKQTGRPFVIARLVVVFFLQEGAIQDTYKQVQSQHPQSHSILDTTATWVAPVAAASAVRTAHGAKAVLRMI